jgi:hypothetical protein
VSILLTVLIVSGWLGLAVVTMSVVRAGARADDDSERDFEVLAELAVRRPAPQHAVDPGAAGYGAVLLRRLAIQACRVVGVEGAAIMRHDGEHDELVTVAAHRLDPDLIGQRLPAADPLSHLANGKGGRRFVRADELERWAFLLPAGGDALAAAPTTGDGQGVVVVCGRGPFAERDLALLGELAQLTSAGLEDARRGGDLDAAIAGGVRSLEAMLGSVRAPLVAAARELEHLAVTTGRSLGLCPAGLIELGLAARIGDVGRVASGESNGDPGPLLSSLRAYELVAQLPGLEVVALVLRHEQERWDGLGLPEGLAGHRIPLGSRILVACRALGDARRKTDAATALELVGAEAGGRFDPAVVDALTIAAGPGDDLASTAARHPGWAAGDRELIAA